MTMKVRVLLVSVVVASTMWVGGCDHYTCGATFGSATCSSSGSTGLSGGTGAGSASAYAFIDNSGEIEEMTLDTTAGTLLDTSGYTSPTVPQVEGWGMAVAQGQYLYTAFPGVGQIYGYVISSDGTLTAINGTPLSAPYMVGSTIGGVQNMITNPAGTFLFVLNQAEYAVYVYSIGSGGVLAQVGSPLLLPFEPENMTTDGLGKYLYVSDVVAGDATDSIAAYSIGSTGTLTAVPGSPFTSTGLSLTYSMWQMQGESTGKYLIGTTATLLGDNHLYVLSIGSNGAITPVNGSPFITTYSPYRIAVQPSAGGDLVYSFSYNAIEGGDNPVEGYTLNTTTGVLTAMSNSPFSGAAADWGQFDQSGTYLFAYDSESTSMSVYNVSTSSALTTPVATVGFFNGAWSVADVP